MVYSLVSVLTLIADKIVPIGLALIDYKLMSVFTLIADEIVPIGLASIDYKLVSGFDINYILTRNLESSFFPIFTFLLTSDLLIFHFTSYEGGGLPRGSAS